MQVIDHGNSIIEYQDIIENPYDLIAVIEDLDNDSGVYRVLPKFQEWMEGHVQPDGVWRAVNTKGRNKVVQWSETTDAPELKAVRERVSAEVIDRIWLPLCEAIKDYAGQVKAEVPEIVTRNLDIRVYATGESLGPHTDTNHDGDFTHYSLVIYYNDDYEGGELRFPDLGIEIKPKAGTIVAFPATTLHEALSTTKGEKWHTPCFWYAETSIVTAGKEPPSLDRFKKVLKTL